MEKYIRIDRAFLADDEAEEFARKIGVYDDVEKVVKESKGEKRCVTVFNTGSCFLSLVCRWSGYSKADDNGWAVFVVSLTKQEQLGEALRLMARATDMVVFGKQPSRDWLN